MRKPMTGAERLKRYHAQNGSDNLRPGQRRRHHKKCNHRERVMRDARNAARRAKRAAAA